MSHILIMSHVTKCPPALRADLRTYTQPLLSHDHAMQWEPSCLVLRIEMQGVCLGLKNAIHTPQHA